MDVMAISWSFRIKRCKSWEYQWDTVWVEASNYVGDSIDFLVTLHQDDYPIAYDFDSSFMSNSFLPFQAEEVVNDYILNDIDVFLKAWQNRISNLRNEVLPRKWPESKGYAADDYLYAVVAKLYEERASVGDSSITESLASDMKVSSSTAKERIRKAREKEFLSRPGKGAGGQAEITKKAIKTLTERGLI
jgi:hypothetical protein